MKILWTFLISAALVFIYERIKRRRWGRWDYYSTAVADSSTADFDIVDKRNPAQEIRIANFMGFELIMINVVTDVINMINDGNDDAASLVFFEEILQRVDVFILRLSNNLIFIYRDGDPEVEEILKARFEQLPEFLSSENNEIRLLAKWKLDTLTSAPSK